MDTPPFKVCFVDRFSIQGSMSRGKAMGKGGEKSLPVGKDDHF